MRVLTSLLVVSVAAGLSLPVTAQVDVVDAATPKKTISQLTKTVAPSIFRLAAFDGDTEIANGTGFVIRSDGILVTNHHVIDGASSEFFAVAADGSRHRVLGSLADDADHDIAIVKVDVAGLVPLQLAESTTIHVGDQVFILGSSHGLDLSLGVGVIAAIRASFPPDFAKRMEKRGLKAQLGPLIQHTASSAPGSSGSPLIDASGTVVGVHHSGFNDSSMYFGAHVDLLRDLIRITDFQKEPKAIGPNVPRNLAISAAFFSAIAFAVIGASKFDRYRRHRRAAFRERQ